MRRFPLVLAIAVASVLSLRTAAARAADPPGDRLHWEEGRPRFRAVEYAVTLVTGLGAIAMYQWLPSQKSPHWVGGILFDDAIRNALRVRSPSALRTVWAFSDGIGVTETSLVVGLDSVIVPLARGSFDVAWQLTWIDLESYALGSVVTFTLYDSVGRARPSYVDCQSNPWFVGCQTSPTASFPSGHTAEAFISAGLSCANHAFVPIYGNRFADAFACARDVTLATTDGVLRIMGDRHYATDALAGAAIGFSFGFGLPTVLHYAGGRRARGGFAFAPLLVDGHVGMAAAGVF